MNVFLLLDQAATRFGERGAVYVGDRQVRSFAQLRDRALRLSARLCASLPAGSRIALASENCAEYIEIMFGVWAAQCVFVPLNYKLHAREQAQIVADAGAATVFASPALADDLRRTLRDAAPPQQADTLDVVQIGSSEFEHMFVMEPAAPPRSSDPQALAWLFYTSGTTGRSKGAMLTHRNLMAMTVAHLADVDALDETMSHLLAAPLSHGCGLYVLPSLLRGARQVVPASCGFDAAEFLDLCDTHPACTAFLAPTMVQRLRVEAERTGRRPRGLRTIVYGGGPMYVEELRKSLAVFGQVFAQIYGQGEAPMTITSLGRVDHATDDPSVLGSVGWPRTGVQVAVVDGRGAPLPTGEIGDVVCRGDVVMAGYWNNDAASADALRDGWLRTGDMGSFDARGLLTLRDRSKDVVISGGSNIYPREVEEALLGHSGVSEACVVGQPDVEWGEIVVAFVVARDGAIVTPHALDAHCLEHIARFKRPKKYFFVDALPKNSYGKVLKRQLREQLAAADQADGTPTIQNNS